MALAKRKDTARAAKTRPKPKLWVASVKTDSTHPPEGLFTKKASTIARTLASKKVSPKGPVSGLRMLTYFINRAGKGLSASRRTELEKAKDLLSKRIHGTAASK
jgi:tRNA(adenine34) deaminase